MKTATALLRDITEFCRETGMTESQLAYQSCGDSRVIRLLREGRTITLTRYDQIREAIKTELARHRRKKRAAASRAARLKQRGPGAKAKARTKRTRQLRAGKIPVRAG